MERTATDGLTVEGARILLTWQALLAKTVKLIGQGKRSASMLKLLEQHVRSFNANTLVADGSEPQLDAFSPLQLLFNNATTAASRRARLKRLIKIHGLESMSNLFYMLLPTRARNCLSALGAKSGRRIVHLDELVQYSDRQLLTITHCGPKTVRVIERHLEQFGLSLAMFPDDFKKCFGSRP